MLPGDFAVVEIDSLPGRAIRFGQWLNGDGFVNYEHAVLYLGYGQILEAQPGGAVISPLNRYAPSKMLWSSNKISLAASERVALVDYGKMMVGTPYSAADYFSIAAARFHIRLPGLKKYVADSNHMICSQLVDYVYQKAGINLFKDGRWPGDVTPADLAELII